MTYLKLLENNPLKSYSDFKIIFALVLIINLGLEIKKWFEWVENRYAGVLDNGENEYRSRACAACSACALRTS